MSTSHVWVMRTAFVGLALLIIFFRLLPLSTQPSHWAPPDLLVAFSFAWVLRRPSFVPVILLASVMLLADFMFSRPPGLMAMLVVLGADYLKTRAAGMSEASFVGEWTAVALALVGIAVLNRIVLGVLGVEQAPMLLTLSQLLLTVAVYPLVAFISQSLLGVRKLTPSDADVMGLRA